jgi:hypothetical protein
VVGDAVLEEDVVERKGSSPSSSSRGQQWHGYTETNFGSHFCGVGVDREVVDHLIEHEVK